MKTITWVPGTNSELDELYDHLRDLQYKNKSHRLWKNYSPEQFKDAVAFTIHWDSDNEPELCSSISSRPCWPNNAYRILNRMWKVNEKKKQILKRVSDCVGLSAISQLEWLNNNTNFELAFCSRQTSNWEQWTIANFQEHFNLEFNTDKYQYLTCSNECDDTCWQKIIYSGNSELLSSWKRRL